MCISLCLSGLITEICVLRASDIVDVLKGICFLSVIWGIMFWIFYKLKNQGYRRQSLPPYVIKADYENFEALAEHIATFFKTRQTNYNFHNKKVIFNILKSKNLVIRNFIYDFDVFSCEKFAEAERLSVKEINKLPDYKKNISLTSKYKYIRLNIIVVKNLNEEIVSTVNQNADYAFSRVEPILNTVYDASRSEFLIPAHFGLSNYTTYNKLYYTLEKCIKKTRGRFSCLKMSEQ